MTVDGLEVVNLSAIASDPENHSLSYLWETNGGGTFSDTATDSPTWTAPATTLATQHITLTLTVTDSLGSTATGTVAITIDAGTPPTASISTADQTVLGGTDVSLSATSDGVAFTWTSSAGGIFVDGNTLTPTWTAPATTVAEQVIVLSLIVRAANGLVNSDNVTITVQANQSPTIDSLAASETSVDPREIISLTVTTTDPESQDLTYAWSSNGGGSFRDGENGADDSGDTLQNPHWIAPASSNVEQNITLSLTVTDTFGATDTDTVDITVSHQRTACCLHCRCWAGSPRWSSCISGRNHHKRQYICMDSYAGCGNLLGCRN